MRPGPPSAFPAAPRSSRSAPRPSRLDLLVSTTGLRELIEYNPADLVVRAQAGLPLAELQAIVGAAGQRLALDPPEAGATLGGVVAANASGPRRHRFGTVRDLLIGATFVLADGTVAHTGGKVVKNVAGYDLAKLLTGSYGTLAVLADVTFRLHGLPACVGGRADSRCPRSPTPSGSWPVTGPRSSSRARSNCSWRFPPRPVR